MKLRQTPSRDEQQAFLDYGDRVVDGDTAPPTTDLESTFLRVQRAMRADQRVPGTMPDHLRMRAWEDVMQNTAIAPSHNSTIGQRRKSYPLPRMAWTGAANVALAILVIIAGFGAWRAFDGGFAGGNNNPAPSGGRYAQAPMTPLPIATAPTSAPVESLWACDISGDIPIVPDVSSSALDGTSLYITPRNQMIDDPTGTLMLHCVDEPEDIELAQRVVSAGGGPIPGVVQLSVLPDGATTLEEQIPAYLNLLTGQSIEFAGFSIDSSEHDWSSIPGSPWVVGRVLNNPAIAELVNLQTMESRPLDDLTGADVASGTDIPGIGVVANDTTVLAFTQPYTGPGEGGTIMTDTGAPGDLMILGEDFDNIRWIDLPESLQYVRDMWLSPDGSAIALSVFDGATQLEESRSYAIISAEDGTLIGQSGPITALGNPIALWIQDSGAITYTAGDTVQVLRADPGAQPEVVLEPGQELFSVRTTYDPDVLVASIRKDHGTDADPASTDVDKVFSVNIATGATHEFDGMEIGDIHSQIMPQANVLLMYDFVALESPVMVTAYDPVSGALIAELGELPSPHTGSLTVGKDSFSSSPEDGTTIFTVGWQNILLVQVENGSPTITRVEPPTESTGRASAVLSPDGQTLSLVNTIDESRSRWLLDLSNPDAEWIEIPNEAVGSDPGMVLFIRGTGS